MRVYHTPCDTLAWWTWRSRSAASIGTKAISRHATRHGISRQQIEQAVLSGLKVIASYERNGEARYAAVGATPDGLPIHIAFTIRSPPAHCRPQIEALEKEAVMKKAIPRLADIAPDVKVPQFASDEDELKWLEKYDAR